MGLTPPVSQLSHTPTDPFSSSGEWYDFWSAPNWKHNYQQKDAVIHMAGGHYILGDTDLFTGCHRIQLWTKATRLINHKTSEILEKIIK